MPVRPYRIILLAGIATLALLAAGARDALAQQINWTNIRHLDFGSIVASSGGTVVVTPAGVRSRTGGVVLLTSSTVGQAALNLSRGSGNKTDVRFTFPPNGSVRLTSGANSMAVGNFVSSPGSPMAIVPPATLSIGATLTVAPNQAPGIYSGTFQVTVNYQ